MSYTKQTWNTGDVITAAKLNHMEDGIAQGGTNYDLVLTETFPSTGDPTLTGYGLSISEIVSKINSGEEVLVKYTYNSTVSNYTVISTYAAIEDNSGDKDIKLTNNPESTTLFLARVQDGSIINTVCISAWSYYTYTYDSTSKEYTFTFDHYAE